MTDLERIEEAIKKGGREKGKGYDVFIYNTFGQIDLTLYKKVCVDYYSYEEIEFTFEFDIKGNLKEIN